MMTDCSCPHGLYILMRQTKQMDKEINKVIVNCAKSSGSHDAGAEIRKQSLGQCKMYIGHIVQWLQLLQIEEQGNHKSSEKWTGYEMWRWTGHAETWKRMGEYTLPAGMVCGKTMW